MSATSSKILIFNPADHPPLAPTYSHISTVPLSPTTTLITIAGQVGVSPPNASDFNSPSTPPPSFPTQVRTALSNLDKCLSAAGAKKADIFATRQYVVGLGSLGEEDRNARARIYLEWLGGLTPPPNTLVGPETLTPREVLYEIEAQAVVYSS